MVRIQSTSARRRRPTVSRSDPCASCGLCCRSYLVPLFGHDLYRLVVDGRRDPRDFVFFCEQETPDRVGFRLNHDGPTYGLALSKQEAFEVDRPCVFLVQADDGSSGCSVYDHRPIACATYPMARQFDRIAIKPTALCPPNAWATDEPERPEWRASLQRLARYRDTYVEVIARWNAWVDADPSRDHPPEHFIGYVLQVYRRLSALDDQLEPGGLAHLERAWATFSHDAPRSGARGNEPPWLEHLRLARAVIDEFFPELPPLPFNRIELTQPAG